jgi:hypothetical protein
MKIRKVSSSNRWRRKLRCGGGALVVEDFFSFSLDLKTNDGHRLIVNISSPQRGGSDETIILMQTSQTKTRR